MTTTKRDDEEMSMEEILSSIRRYVADDSELNAAEKTIIPPRGGLEDSYVVHPAYETYGHTSHHSYFEPAPEDVVRLTEAYEAPSPVPESTGPREFRPASPMPSSSSDTLLSEKAKTSSTQAFSKLMETASNPPQQKETPVTSSATAGVTLDHLITDIARPMIKQWLDNNLPSLVESLVNKEIEKITRNLQNR